MQLSCTCDPLTGGQVSHCPHGAMTTQRRCHRLKYRPRHCLLHRKMHRAQWKQAKDSPWVWRRQECSSEQVVTHGKPLDDEKPENKQRNSLQAEDKRSERMREYGQNVVVIGRGRSKEG